MLRDILVQDLVDRHAGDALTQHQTHHIRPQKDPQQQPSPSKGRPAQKTAMQQQQQIQRGRHQPEAEKLSTQGHDKLSRQQDGRYNASKRIPASRPKIWMR